MRTQWTSYTITVRSLPVSRVPWKPGTKVHMAKYYACSIMRRSKYSINFVFNTWMHPQAIISKKRVKRLFTIIMHRIRIENTTSFLLSADHLGWLLYCPRTFRIIICSCIGKTASLMSKIFLVNQSGIHSSLVWGNSIFIMQPLRWQYIISQRLLLITKTAHAKPSLQPKHNLKHGAMHFKNQFPKSSLNWSLPILSIYALHFQKTKFLRRLGLSCI